MPKETLNTADSIASQSRGEEQITLSIRRFARKSLHPLLSPSPKLSEVIKTKPISTNHRKHQQLYAGVPNVNVLSP